MPKLKTHKSTVKRIKITGTGKLMRKAAACRHLLTNKSDRRNTDLEISPNDKKRIKKLLTRG